MDKGKKAVLLVHAMREVVEEKKINSNRETE